MIVVHILFWTGVTFVVLGVVHLFTDTKNTTDPGALLFSLFALAVALVVLGTELY